MGGGRGGGCTLQTAVCQSSITGLLELSRRPTSAEIVQAPQRGKTLELPPNCPGIAKYLFEACTQMNPDNRPTASKIVEWLRQS